MKIEIDDGTVNTIIGQSLGSTIDFLLESIDHRKNGGSIPYYDDDPLKDIAHIEEKIKAIHEVLDLYGLEY